MRTSKTLVASGLNTAPATQGCGGHSLPASVSGFFEPRFGHNFGKVRVHTDDNAAAMARAFNARAFTIGNDIYFGSRQYAAGTFGGDQIIGPYHTRCLALSDFAQFQPQSGSVQNFPGYSYKDSSARLRRRDHDLRRRLPLLQPHREETDGTQGTHPPDRRRSRIQPLLAPPDAP